MSFHVEPIALGRDHSDQELHVWDPRSGLDKRYSDVKKIHCECKWGAGLIEANAALILYLFDGEETIEVYFSQKVPVGPKRVMNSWDVLLSIQPVSLTLVHGSDPKDRSKWLRVECDHNDLMTGLDEFFDHIMKLNEKDASDPVTKEILTYVKGLLKESPH